MDFGVKGAISPDVVWRMSWNGKSNNFILSSLSLELWCILWIFWSILSWFFEVQCWASLTEANTCKIPVLWGHWGLRPAALLKSQRKCSSVCAKCRSSNKKTSLYLFLSIYLSLSFSLVCQATTAASTNCHGNRSRCWGVFPIWWDVNYWPLSLKKERNSGNGYGFMRCGYDASNAAWHTICHCMYFLWCGLTYLQRLNNLIHSWPLGLFRHTHIIDILYCMLNLYSTNCNKCDDMI